MARRALCPPCAQPGIPWGMGRKTSSLHVRHRTSGCFLLDSLTDLVKMLASRETTNFLINSRKHKKCQAKMLTQKFLNKNYTFSSKSLEAPHNLPLFKPRAKGTKNYCLTEPAELDHLLETRDVQTRDNREPRTSQTTNSRYDTYIIYLHHTSLYTVHLQYISQNIRSM